MFRYTVGDSTFFASIKSYATDTVNFKYKNATIPDFITKMNQTSGQNLDWFFNEWLAQPNHPVYSNMYSIANNGDGTWTVNFNTQQTQSNSGFFKMPVELEIQFTSGKDTIIKVMNDSNNQLFYFIFNSQPDSLIFDPNDNIVIKQASITVGLKEYNSSESSIKLYQNNPNPFAQTTQIVFELPSRIPVKIAIYNGFGKLVTVLLDKNMKSGQHKVEFNSSGLSKGIYFYTLESGNIKIVKKMIIS